MTVPFRHEIIRRFSDIDQQRHVNNVVYFDYLQDTRVALFHEVWQSTMLEMHQVMVHQEMRYHKSLLLNLEPIVIEVWVSKVGNSSYTLGYRVLDEVGGLSAEANTTIACINPDTGRPVRIPSDLRTVLEGLRLDA